MNAAALLWARSLLRRNRRATMFLALFSGLAAASVMTAWQYSRRADTVVQRRLAVYQPADGTVHSCSPGIDVEKDFALCFTPESNETTYKSVADSPHVAAASLLGVTTVEVALPSDPATVQRTFAGSTIDRAGGITNLQMIAGRSARADSTDEAVVNERTGQVLGVGVGDMILLAGCPESFYGAGQPCDAVTTVKIVGVVRTERDLRPPRRGVSGKDEELLTFGILPSKGWWELHGRQHGGFISIDFRLAPDATIDDVRGDLTRSLPGWSISVSPNEDLTLFDALNRSVRLQAQAMFAMALILLVAGIVLVGQTLARQVASEISDHESIVALGFARRSISRVLMLRAIPISVAAAAVAVIVTSAVSSLGPFGLAYRAEVDRRLKIDVPVLVIGGITVALSVTAIIVLTGMMAGRTELRRASPLAPRMFRVIARISVPAQAGVQIMPRRRQGWQLRTAFVGTVAAVAGLVGAAIVVDSLQRVEREPKQFGAWWDYGVGDYSDQASADAVATRIGDDPIITSAAFVGSSGPVVVGSAPPCMLVAFQALKGDAGPLIVEGRAPVADDEMALGPATMRALGKHIGDTVGVSPVSIAGADSRARGDATPPLPMRIVGVAMISNDSTDFGPGKGVVVTWKARLSLDGAPDGHLVVTVDRSVSRTVAIEHLSQLDGRSVTVPSPQPDITNLRSISAAPWLIAGLVALLALASLGHALVTNIRRSRRQLGVLRTLGFTRWQVSRTVAWQATTLAVVAAIAGAPAGVVGGRWGWRLLANEIGLTASPIVSVVWALAVALVAVVTSNLIAIGPGISAGRHPLADTLHSE